MLSTLMESNIAVWALGVSSSTIGYLPFLIKFSFNAARNL
jgi:hypothetical protein